MKTYSLFFQCLSLAGLTSLSIWHGYTFLQSRVQEQQQKTVSLVLTDANHKGECCVDGQRNQLVGEHAVLITAREPQR